MIVEAVASLVFCFVRIADGFWQEWQFPNCLGSADGLHVPIPQPSGSGGVGDGEDGAPDNDGTSSTSIAIVNRFVEFFNINREYF